VRKKYEALLPHVASRYDLTYILGEMVGELSNSHTYVNSPADSGLHPVAEGLLGTTMSWTRRAVITASKRSILAKTGCGIAFALTEPG